MREAIQIATWFSAIYFGLSLGWWKPHLLKWKIWFLVWLNTLVLMPILSIVGLRFLRINNTWNWRDSWKLAFCALCFELSFYIMHRLSHKIYFNKIHAIHHSIIHQCGFTGLYAHPIDFIFCNFFPGVLGLLILRDIPKWILYTWISLASSYVVISHQIPNFHLDHHNHATKNFGTLGILDFLLGSKKY